jgi:hypothetical protein
MTASHVIKNKSLRNKEIKMKKTLLAVLAVLMVIGLLNACGTPAPADSSKASSAAADRFAGVPKGTWVVGFCNGMTGNAWRAAHVDAWQQECKLAQEAGLISKYYTANVDGQTAQIASISDFISKGCNLICIEADSGPALGPVIQEALDKGITVVTTDPCGLTVKEGGKVIDLMAALEASISAMKSKNDSKDKGHNTTEKALAPKRKKAHAQ